MALAWRWGEFDRSTIHRDTHGVKSNWKAIYTGDRVFMLTMIIVTTRKSIVLDDEVFPVFRCVLGASKSSSAIDKLRVKRASRNQPLACHYADVNSQRLFSYSRCRDAGIQMPDARMREEIVPSRRLQRIMMHAIETSCQRRCTTIARAGRELKVVSAERRLATASSRSGN